MEYRGKKPIISVSCFLAETATVAGDVTIGEDSSVWFGAVLRAEAAPISMGSGSNVQDNCTVHTDQGFPVVIEDGVSIGHGTVIHGARIGSNTLIGMGSTLMNGSQIGANCVLGAGSLLLQGAVIPDNMLVLGSPASAKRQLTQEEMRAITQNAAHYREFKTEYEKTQRR